MRKNLWTICSTVALVTFTTYITMDTFVISKSYNTNATEMNTAMFVDSEKVSDDDSEIMLSGESKSNADDSAVSENSASTDDSAQPSNTGGSGRHKSHSGKRHSSGGSSEGSVNKSETDNNNDEASSYESSNDNDANTSSDTGRGNITNYASNETATDRSNATGTSTGGNTVTTDNYTITLSEYYQNDTRIYVADVDLSSAQYLKTAFANDTYGKNVTATTSSIAESNDAILAINGDYYGVQESGYVIRNGIVYRDTANGSEVLCIYADGTMKVINDAEHTAEELVEMGVWQAFSFGPALIEDSTIAVDADDEVGKAMASNPRTAIGVIDANHFVFVVSDGRTSESEGLSLYELAEFMDSLGVETAYNLDGGGSSTMYFNGYVVNNPTSGRSIKERSVSDIIYI